MCFETQQHFRDGWIQTTNRELSKRYGNLLEQSEVLAASEALGISRASKLIVPSYLRIWATEAPVYYPMRLVGARRV